MSCGEGGPSPNMPVGEACRSLTILPGRKLSQTAHYRSLNSKPGGSEMPANVTHVVSRVGVQPDWNSLVLSHFGRVRCVCLVA